MCRCQSSQSSSSAAGPDGTATLPCRRHGDAFVAHDRSAEQLGLKAMNTSRRILLAGLAGLAVAPTAAPAFAATQAADDATVADERFARLIAVAHAPDVTCANQA